MAIKPVRFVETPQAVFLTATGQGTLCGPFSDIVRAQKGISVDRLLEAFEQALLRGCETAQQAEDVVRVQLGLELN